MEYEVPERPERRVTGPSSEEWTTYRQIILDLYIGHKMSLPRLSAYMVMHHQFHASEKMYRARFAQWGAKKNMTADRVRAALEQSRTHKSTPAAADTRKINQYISRLPEKSRRRLLESMPELLAAGRPGSGVIAPGRFEQSRDMQACERCIWLLQDYVQGSSEGGLWARDPHTGFRNEDVVPAWCSPAMSAAWVLKEGKSNEANTLLQQFVRQCPEQLQRHDPLLFAFTYTSVLFFVRSYPAVATFLLRNFCNVSESLPWAGSLHPLRLLLRLLNEIGPEKMFVYADKILLAYVDMIHKALGEAYPIVQDMLSDAMDRLLAYRLISPETLVALGERMLSEAETQGRDRSKFSLGLKLQIASSYLRLGHFELARDIAAEVMASRNDDIRDGEMVMKFHMVMYKINEAKGQPEQAAESALRSLVASINTFGELSDWAVNNLIIYRKALQNTGKSWQAEAVIQDRDRAIEELCNRQ